MAADKQNKPAKAAESSLVRLSKIPLVEFTIMLTLNAYNKVKSSSELLTNVLNRAEKIATATLGSLRPVAGKFEKQINYVDSFGNVLLDKVETSVPSVVKFNPKTVYANQVNRLVGWRNYGAEKLNQVRNFNLAKTVNGGLKVVDGYVDEWLPGTEEENNENSANNETEQSVTGQLYSTFGKVRRRSIRKLQNVQRLVF